MTSKSAFILTLVLAAGLQAQSRQIQLRGRVLEKANLAPVAGATVKFLGTALTATTDAQGAFTLTGTTTVRPSQGLIAESPRFQGRYLVFPASLAGARARASSFDARGTRLATTEFRVETGSYRLDMLPVIRGGSPAFLRLEIGDKSFLYRILLGVAGGSMAAMAGPILPSAMLAKSAASGSKSDPSPAASAASQLEAGAPLLVTKTVDLATDTGKVPDIILDYPPRKLDVGAPPIHGSVVLFGGEADSAGARAEMEAKWVHWINPWRASKGLGATPVLWKIRPDPEDPSNPRKRTISPCCLPRDGSPEWGYDDLQSKARFKDFQLHIEFNMWGGPNDANAGAYANSGVYLQSRYEIQIETPPNPWNPANNHGIASIIDEFPPVRNAIRAPGKWQAYDITFRAARWNGNSRTEKARMTIWWNGVLVHNNRESGGPLANPGIGGAAMDSSSQGLKLQNEKGLDVRYRNIWIKELDIAKPETNFGY